MNAEPLIAVDLDDRARTFMVSALAEWMGPSRCSEELAVALGFAAEWDFYQQIRRLIDAVGDALPLTRGDWTRALGAAEVAFASDTLANCSDWQFTVGRDLTAAHDDLRRLQQQLADAGVTRSLGSFDSTSPPELNLAGGWESRDHTERLTVEQRGYLWIAANDDAGDFDPDAVTARLGLTPTKTWRRGELGPYSQPRRHSSWRLDIPTRIELDCQALVVEVLNLIEPHREALEATRSSLGLVAGINLVARAYTTRNDDGYLLATTPSVGITKDVARRLGDLGLDLDIDQYVL